MSRETNPGAQHSRVAGGSFTLRSGRRGALLRRAPLRTVHATRRRTRLKQAARASRRIEAIGVVAADVILVPLAISVYETVMVIVRRVAPVVVIACFAIALRVTFSHCSHSVGDAGWWSACKR